MTTTATDPHAETSASTAVDRRSWALPLIALFLGGFAIRWLLAVVLLPDGGHHSDIEILTDWTHELAANGPAAFYRADSGFFADYPPVYLYILWLTGLAGRAWSAAFGGADVTPFMLKLPLMLADLGVAAVAMLLTRHLWGVRAGVVAAAVCLFNPAFIFLSAVWGQNDSIATLLLLSAIYLLVTGRTELATIAAVLAMLFKFQYGFAIPIVAIVGLRRHLLGWGDGDGTTWSRDLRRVGLSLAAGVVTLLVVIRPFGLYLTSPDDPAHSLIHRFLEASKAFPGVTQNAFNLWMNPYFDVIRVGSSGFTEGHVVDDTAVVIAGLGVTWQTLGNLLFAVAVVIALAAFLRRSDGIAIVVVALTIAVAFFVLPTRIHERYLYPALALGLPLLAAGIAWRRLYVALTAVLFLDVYWVYSLPIGNAGPGRGILGDTIYRPAGIYALSAVATVSMAWLVWRVWRPLSLPWAATARVVAAPDADAPEQTRAVVTAVRGEVVVAGAAMLDPLDRWLRRLGAWVRARPTIGIPRFVVVLAIISALTAVIVARIHGPGGPWLWNLDLPKIDFPLASFFHDALAAGRLPLWNDDLGLGFPLYAEGQIGAFYPPNWLFFQFPPLVALDLSRLFHLTMLGTGVGTLVLVIAGSRTGAVVATLTAVLGGAIAAKLQWHNLVAAYAFLPWVLLPLVRRPAPTRGGLVAAGLLFGVQAWTGHPNTWLLTGLAATIVLLTISPTPRQLGRVIGFGLLGGAVGAVQLFPTLLLTTLSVRSDALTPTDLFTSASTPFDVLLFGFQNAFLRVSDGAWDIYTNWYPDGTFALLEAAAFVGLPILVLAAVGARGRRSRPFLVLIVVGLAIPIIAAFRPDPWTHIPILNGLRSPVRAYLLVSLGLAVLAGIGVGRLGRSPRAVRRAVIVLAVPIAAYVVTLVLVTALPAIFDWLLLGASSFLGPADLADRRDLAIQALTRPIPFLLEVAAGFVALAIVVGAARRPAWRLGLAPVALVTAAVPLLILGPLPNGARPLADFSFAGTEFVQAVIGTAPQRFLTMDPPGWYSGMPDQLAAAGVRDLRMFSSLDLLASDAVVDEIVKDDPDGALRRAVGVDVIATFDQPCPGTTITTVESEGGATLCRDDAARRPPYLLPADVVTVPAGPGGSLIKPRDAEIDVARIASTATDLVPTRRDGSTLEVTVDAPTAGWVWVDRTWWPGWRTTVDGVAVDAARALGGQLIPVPAGTSVVRQDFVPWDAGLGLALGIAATIIALVWWRRPWRRGRAPQADEGSV